MTDLPGGWQHGYSAYANGKCRCDICRAAFAAYYRQYRARRRSERLRGESLPKHVEHGTMRAYRYMCRCDQCRAANADRSRAWRARHRAEVA